MNVDAVANVNMPNPFPQIAQLTQDNELKEDEKKDGAVECVRSGTVPVPPPPKPSTFARPSRKRQRLQCRSNCCSPDEVKTNSDVDKVKTTELCADDNAKDQIQWKTASNEKHTAEDGHEIETHQHTKPKLKMNVDKGDFYEVRALSENSPDSRNHVDKAIAELASALREEPTIPADPQKTKLPWSTATEKDLGLVLPPKHCAFSGCLWWFL